uniref:Uncharacterized protein n=1 Tax=Anopheles farauti TaxID=69004 RepID=A0A182QKJ9_9DIPT
MATRLAMQRNFITVIPATATGGTSAAVPVTVETGDENITLQKTVVTTNVDAATAGGNESPASSDPSDSVEVAEVATTAMASRSSNAPQTTTTLPTITVAAGALKNGSAKGPLMSTTLLANNANIMNLLSGANGLSLQQIIHKKHIVINPNGTVDIVPYTDESDSVELKVENEKLLEGGATVNENTESGNSSEATGDETAQVATQVAVVQSQSPTSGTPQYIAVTDPRNALERDKKPPRCCAKGAEACMLRTPSQQEGKNVYRKNLGAVHQGIDYGIEFSSFYTVASSSLARLLRICAAGCVCKRVRKTYAFQKPRIVISGKLK